MADTVGMQDLRGIDIQKLAVGFAEESIILKKFLRQASTSNRELRWFQKTAGFITGTTTSGITSSSTLIANTSEGALPFIREQSMTRQTSYVRKYFIESPLFADEDLRDSDPDIWAGNVRDLVRSIEYQIELRIWDVISESQSAVNINTVATNAAWNTASYTGVNIIEDLSDAKLQIRTYGYNPEGAVLLLSPLDHKSLITWLIDGKGSSIPAFASQKIQDGIVMEILGLRVIVSTVVTADYALVMVPESAVWKAFTPITTAVIEDRGIGTKIRIWEEGECILEQPRSVCLITNTQA